MADDPRVQQLVDQLLDSHAAPEEVCAPCPELLPVVRERFRRMRRVLADIDALFPPPDVPGTKPDALFPPPSEPASQPPEGTALPHIPGYEVEAVLGRGGVGVVYKARDLRLNREVAVKMLLAGAYAGPVELERFLREAEAVAGLRHANIVQVYEVGDLDGRPYFTMELVEGGSLAQKLAGAPLPADRAAALTAALADAVEAAHRGGVVHRDLKPANVLLTADGTPKVTDFGLARRLEGGDGLTLSGAPMGTPSYMAPEQARGQKDAVGPATDVYGLGAILYELLTGRPPFRAESAAETVLQVLHQEPAAPSRLNARVPRDLETVCLKCLYKAPARRYASAQELAADLRRFLEGKPVRARPVGPAERAAKWARRRPAAALLVAALLVMVGAAVGTGVWMRQQEADRRAAKDRREGQAREVIATALKRADELRKEERFQEAVHVLADASPHVADADSPELEQRLHQAQSDFRIADDFERVRESRPLTPIGGGVDFRQRAADYQEAFDRAGLQIGEDADPIAASIRASAIHEQIEAAIDDWAVVAFLLDDGPSVERLLRIARAADPEPHWRDRFHDPAVWQSTDRLQELGDDAFAASPPPPGYQVALLGLLLMKKGGATRTTQLLREACRRQPGNFWLCREMADALSGEGRLDEAAGYYRAALAVRPENAGAHAELGMVLSSTGQTDYGLAELRRAVELAPDAPSMRTILVDRLATAGYWKEAAAACRSALEADPHNPRPPLVLGESLWHNGRIEDAVVLLRKAAEIDPSFVTPHNDLGLLFWQTGQPEEAAKAFRAVTQLTPRDRYAHQRLGLELARTGHPAEAINELQAAIALRPTEVTLHYQLHMDLGAVLRSQRRLEEAADSFRQATTIAPQDGGWRELAAVLLDQGRFVEARAATQRFLDLPANNAMSARRLAQQRQLDLCDSLHAIDAKLPAILAGEERPTDVPTQLALAEWCLRHKRLTGMAAGYYTSVLSAKPSLADDPEAGVRFDAACAAALAGCGGGEDAGKLDELRRAELRKQAFDWLTAEYGAWAERHRLGKPGDHRLVATAVRSWLNNDDLAGVRDEQALARLPADERQDWQALWEKAAALAARDPVELTLQAREHVSRREWAKAAECYGAALELEPTENAELWYEYSASQLLARDRPGYRRACAHMLAHGQATPPMRPYLVARACTLAPDSADDPELPGRLSAAELSGSGTAFWSLTEQGALAVRAGRSQEAVPLLERSFAADGLPGRTVLNWLWLALAYQKLGKPDEARRWLDRAAEWLDQQGDQMPLVTGLTGLHLHNWLEAQVLLREADALLR